MWTYTSIIVDDDNSLDALTTSWRAGHHTFRHDTGNSEKFSNDHRTSTNSFESIEMLKGNVNIEKEGSNEYR